MIPFKDAGHPNKEVPMVNLSIVFLNIVIFLFFQLPNEAFTMAYSAIPWEILSNTDLIEPVRVHAPDGRSVLIPHEPGPTPIQLTLLTSMFMHGGFMHLAGNMLFLFVYGDNVERALGSKRYLAFYLTCGLLAALAHVFSSASSMQPSVGASGAISGILGAYLVFFPRNLVYALVAMRLILPVPAFFMIGVWIVFQLLGGAAALGGENSSGVAYMAHIGGFAAGAAIAYALRNTADRRMTQTWDESWGRFREKWGLGTAAPARRREKGPPPPPKTG